MSHSKNVVTLVLATMWATERENPRLGWLMVTVGVSVYFWVDNELVGTIALLRESKKELVCYYVACC